MGKVTGFLEIDRREARYAPAAERIRHYREFVLPVSHETIREQAARCMECGIPFCHSGCPVNNQIPDFNDLTYHEEWRQGLWNLHSTNNFPEFTGRVCPAPCEASCTLNLQDAPVTIKSIELALVERGFKEGWIKPEPATRKTGKRVAIIGSGPAGLACAQQLARVGHEVHVFEKHARPGGLLRYGIPDFKLDKSVIDRRLEQLQAENIVFHCQQHVGKDLDVVDLLKDYDAVVLAGGAEKPRDLPISGRELQGVHFAMDFLPQQNRRLGKEPLGTNEPILAHGKNVLVIGGGDTGSDCIGTSIRQGALSVMQLEIMSRPPEKETKLLNWPNWPMKLRTSSSHEEGAERDFAVTAVALRGEDGRVMAAQCMRVDAQLQPISGSAFEVKAELVLLAMGFVSPISEGLLEKAGVKLDGRGNVAASQETYQTSQEKLFACGDMRRGQSLVVWAIREGRQSARSVDAYLTGNSILPR